MSELTLTDFLLARIAEDEKGADSAMAAGHGCLFAARIHADREAMRRIVRMRLNAEAAADEGVVGMLLTKTLDAVVAALALPYADHPDYREEWKP